MVLELRDWRRTRKSRFAKALVLEPIQIKSRQRNLWCLGRALLEEAEYGSVGKLREAVVSEDARHEHTRVRPRFAFVTTQTQCAVLASVLGIWIRKEQRRRFSIPDADEARLALWLGELFLLNANAPCLTAVVTEAELAMERHGAVGVSTIHHDATVVQLDKRGLADVMPRATVAATVGHGTAAMPSHAAVIAGAAPISMCRKGIALHQQS